MPSGVFKPYAGVSTAILFFTKTNSGGTDNVWFYDMQADGYTLDDKRTPAVNEELRIKNEEFKTKNNGASLPEFIAKDNLPDILARWQSLQTSPSTVQTSELARTRTEQSFLVPKDEIAANDYDLSINRYKEVEYEAVEYAAPKEILATIAQLDADIEAGRKELEDML
jgi:type I restriction enzyme M protein